MQLTYLDLLCILPAFVAISFMNISDLLVPLVSIGRYAKLAAQRAEHRKLCELLRFLNTKN